MILQKAVVGIQYLIECLLRSHLLCFQFYLVAMQLNKTYIHTYVCSYVHICIIPKSSFKAVTDFSLVHNAEFEYLREEGSVSFIEINLYFIVEIRYWQLLEE